MAGNNVSVLPVAAAKPHKITHTRSDTIAITPDVINSWKAPPFQRELRVNEKVKNLAETIKEDDGVIPGVITLGLLNGDTYLLDGQHRAHAFKESGMTSGYVDIRVQHFSDMAEMGDEFVNLNSHLVTMRPDDILKGLEPSFQTLQYLKKKCRFIGYGNIRRNDISAPLLSMSAAIRCWFGSAPETPKSSTESSPNLARTLSTDDAEIMVEFLSKCYECWGKDKEYNRLWSNLNLTILMWFYRRTVLTQYSPNTIKMTKDLFGRCIMALSADSTYLDWLVGRQLGERDRSPAYNRMKAIFVKRIEQETGKKPRLPAPGWAGGTVKK